MQPSTAQLEITYLRTSFLKPDPRNPRVHSDKQVRQIAKSIESFGFNVPLLIDDEQKVIAGHGRLLAARKLGWDTVPAIHRPMQRRRGDATFTTSSPAPAAARR